MSDISGKVAEVFFRLLPQLVDWVQSMLEAGADPEEVEDLFQEHMDTVRENRESIADLINDKFPEGD